MRRPRIASAVPLVESSEESSEAPVLPEASNVPVSSEASNVPDASQAYNVPNASPDAAQASNVPDASPVSSQASNVPDASPVLDEASNVPDASPVLDEASNVPDAAPVLDEVSNVPDAAQASNAPVLDEASNVPDASPVLSEVPAEAPIMSSPPVRQVMRRPRIVSSDVPSIASLPSMKRPHIVSSSIYQTMPNSDLLEAWNTTTLLAKRNQIIEILQKRNLFPSRAFTEWEYESGAYPDTIDPEFLQKLLAKREFAESLQTTWRPDVDPCDADSLFEVTPVQRFVTNFMSPKTPYMSALLFHGVGVGKTCAAVQITEAWLEHFPSTEVYVVAPPTIQQGFYRTIFDTKRVTIGTGSEPNSASQCTGITYMTLTDTLYERDMAKIEKAVHKAIRKRYRVFGYVSFANYIRDALKRIPVHATEEIKNEMKKKIIRNHFTGKLLIVDEAHNLRDIAKTENTGKEDESDTAGGKLLTPYLMDVLMYSEGMKFCALTATPMYNSHVEIIFILNLLLINDKKASITAPDVFDASGVITERGSTLLSTIAQRYVSFMRGENPISFPVRLFPHSLAPMGAYPTSNPRGSTIAEEDKSYFKHLPLVPIVLQDDTLHATIQFMNALPPGGTGLNTIMLEKLVHAGNFIVPSSAETEGNTVDAYTRRTDKDALSTVFTTEVSGAHRRYRAKPAVGAAWLARGALKPYSQKFEFFLERVQNAEGCVFAYTRFVNGGAIPLALVLEANGYTPYHRKSLLADGIQSPGGRQCSRCPRKEKEHGSATHSFSPAYYGILTGNTDISPHNEETITIQRSKENVNGELIKVLIGSQIASEGVDLRFVRETHIIDSWFHLNKTEQIIGRAIRYLSHCMLPKEKRNNTIYLYAAVLPTPTRETADLYSYRVGFKKAVLIGKVTRIMKQSSLDCNLNKDAIIITDQQMIEQIDSQRVLRKEVDSNDMPFTAVCDWIETCDYTCQPKIDVRRLEMDDSTYDEYSARWRIHQIKTMIQERFEEQPFYQSEDLWNLFSLMNIPRMAAVDVLHDIVNNKSFQIKHGDQSGYIRYCNGYYLFQPNVYADLTIPLSIRVARFPIKRDEYTPLDYEPTEWLEEKEEDVQEQVSIETLWTAMESWITSLTTSHSYRLPPPEVNQRVLYVSEDDKDVQTMYQQILEMVSIFYSSFSSYKNPDAFRKALLSYFWDEWLSIEEQQTLVHKSGINVSEWVRENQYHYSSKTIHRYLHPKNGIIEYICENGEVCPKSVADQVSRSETDAIRTIVVNKQTTGPFYGCMVPKYGSFVFKTNEPPVLNGKVGRGKECGNVSNKQQQLAYLISIGDIMMRVHKTDCNLNRTIILESRTVKNSTRACTLMNLFLRFLDAERVDNKRWFFRPVAAYYTQHRGTFAADKVSS